MEKSIAKLTPPVLAGVVRATTTRGAIAEIKNCLYGGAGMIDLHMSTLEDTSVEALKKIVDSTDLPILALNYNNTYHWESAGFTEEERVGSFLRAVEAGAAGVDIQGYTFDLASKQGFVGEDKFSFTKGNPREVVTDEKVIATQRKLIDKVHDMGAEVLLSCHPRIVMNATQVVELALFLEQRAPDVIKIVTRAETEEDLIESFKAMLMLKKEVKTPVTYHAMGKQGMLSRLINPVLGGHMAFCVDRFDAGSTLEQLELRSAKEIIGGLRRYM
ncbi:MAG: type I 3-dehydroquinate dehydratase [Oscillospiraceae bacterium]|nr:type I 3-dehydroquinate dehydratase [Oscillospiraceae bacterium]